MCLLKVISVELASLRADEMHVHVCLLEDASCWMLTKKHVRVCLLEDASCWMLTKKHVRVCLLKDKALS